MMVKKIAIFASGSGSNAENIFNYFAQSKQVCVEMFLTNNPSAYIVERARRLGVECVVFDRTQFYQTDEIATLLKSRGVDFVVLAGFLWLVPARLIEQYPNRIVNVHPALLPAFGGKGMYGDNVHRAVVAAGESESGITVHYVNEIYDNGAIIAQHHCPVLPDDTAESLAQRIHQLEYKHFPEDIESAILSQWG